MIVLAPEQGRTSPKRDMSKGFQTLVSASYDHNDFASFRGGVYPAKLRLSVATVPPNKKNWFAPAGSGYKAPRVRDGMLVSFAIDLIVRLVEFQEVERSIARRYSSRSVSEIAQA